MASTTLYATAKRTSKVTSTRFAFNTALTAMGIRQLQNYWRCFAHVVCCTLVRTIFEQK
jgi:hypothetical protein